MNGSSALNLLPRRGWARAIVGSPPALWGAGELRLAELSHGAAGVLEVPDDGGVLAVGDPAHARPPPPRARPPGT